MIPEAGLLLLLSVLELPGSFLQVAGFPCVVPEENAQLVTIAIRCDVAGLNLKVACHRNQPCGQVTQLVRGPAVSTDNGRLLNVAVGRTARLEEPLRGATLGGILHALRSHVAMGANQDHRVKQVPTLVHDLGIDHGGHHLSMEGDALVNHLH